MPEASQFVGNSIEELLVALADGVRDAQSALNSGPLTDPAGRPLASYQLPYLDFTVQVNMQTRTDVGGKPVALMFMARAAASSNSNTDQQITSTISGRLVATPPGEGLPVPRVALSVGAAVNGAVPLTLTVTNSAGETLANQRVELNIDDADSVSLSAARSVSNFVRSSATRLSAALVTTDANGMASTTLAVGVSDRGTKAVIVVVASIGPFNARVAIPLE